MAQTGEASVHEARRQGSLRLGESRAVNAYVFHPTFPEMAAAYLFHLAKNHPFVDGNKRTALAAALVLLWLNGVQIVAEENDLCELTLGVVEGRVTKAEAASFQRFARPIP